MDVTINVHYNNTDKFRTDILISRNIIYDLEIITDNISAYILNSTNEINSTNVDTYPIYTISDLYNDMNDEMKKCYENIFEIYEKIFNIIKEKIEQNFTNNYGELIRESIKVMQEVIEQVSEKIYDKMLISNIQSYLFNHIIDSFYDKKSKELRNFEKNKFKEKNINVIEFPSLKDDSYDYVIYKNKNNALKIVKVLNRKPKYLINIKENICNCPDFIFRKIYKGGLCKHLKVIQKRTKDLSTLKAIQNKYLYNVNIPLNKMLNFISSE